MAVGFSDTNKPINPRGQDASPKGYNKAELFSGKALDFDGVNDNVDCGTTTNADVVSYAMWVNLDTYSGTGGIIGKNQGDANDHAQIWIYQNSLTFFVGSGSGYEELKTTTPNTGEWFHLVCVADDSTKKQQIYINGVLDVERTFTLSFDDTDRALIVGSINTSAYRFNGKLNGVKQFNTALTAAQVADLYNNPEKIVPTGVDNDALKLWLPMQEGAGTTAYDGSGNGNHGTISGATYTHGIGAPVAQTAVIDWNKGVNKLVNSSDLSDVSNWSRDGDTAIESGYIAPDGSNTAFKVSTSDGSARLVQGNVTDADDYRAIWAKTTSGTGDVNLLSNNANTNNLFTITEEWQKFSLNSAPAAGDLLFYAVDFRGTSVLTEVVLWQPHCAESESVLVPTLATAQTSDVLLPAGLTTGRDITGVNLFENVRKQGALNLDGNSWAEVHDNASLDITDAITLEAWVYWDDSVSHGFLGKWDYSAGKASYLLLKINATKFRFYVSSTGSNASLIENGTTITSGWNHIVGVYDGANIKCYLNGSVDGSTAYSAGLFPNDLKVEIGKYALAKYPNDIAQPRIYNRALTASEVLRNYNSSKNTYK